MTGRPEGPWPDVTGELPQVDSLAPDVKKLDEKTLIDLALDRRPDVQAAMGYVVAARENVRMAKDSTKPTLDLHLDPQNAFVSFSKSFGNNLAKGKEAEAEAQEDQADVSLQQLEDQVRTQVGDAVENLQRSASDWASLDTAEKQMEVVVNDAEKRARFGAINWGDFLNAQNQLSELKRQVIYARLNFAVDLTNLWLATGTIDVERPNSLAVQIARTPSG
jgi:outer membrane protein TolC